ncbi:HAD-IC family P-type ATPase, partial [Halomonas sp. LBP4]|uniref:HAD-IC family P-type ATPase n=1 Tax=Halomonas sp. LBP4 TaxID=2044917 RepID=UPI0035A0A539
MPHDMVIVRPDTPVGDTAEALLNRRISGVHVVDPKKKLIAIVSEGNLMRRPKPGPSGTRGVEVAEWTQRAETLQSEGQTVMFLVADGQVAGLIGVADPIKETTSQAIRTLQADGLRIVMLTGDKRTTAEAVARKLGIDEIEAEVLPQEKGEIVRK